MLVGEERIGKFQNSQCANRKQGECIGPAHRLVGSTVGSFTARFTMNSKANAMEGRTMVN
jgi:hypothetical protein